MYLFLLKSSKFKQNIGSTGLLVVDRKLITKIHNLKPQIFQKLDYFIGVYLMEIP